MRLSELNTGDKAVIVKVSGYGGFRKRIVEMGFIKGKVVEVRFAAPLKDPVEYHVMGYNVSLRRSEAANIEVISLEEAERIAKSHTAVGFHGTITEDDIRQVALDERKTINVALVGNPNAGKTSLFNVASGQNERVGNYSGVTVGAKDGFFDYKGYHIKLVDLPGTYSLSAYSPEEKYVRRQIVESKPDVIVNVLDATNLERNLFLTTQLIDMNLRMVIALNMYDELEHRGDKFDYKTLSKLIGVPIVPTISPRRIGINELFDAVIKLYEGSDILDADGNLIHAVDDDELLDKHHHEIALEHRHGHHQGAEGNVEHCEHVVRHIHINYGPVIEKSIAKIKEQIVLNENARDEFTPRYIAIKLLEHDKEMENFVQQFGNWQDVLATRDMATRKIEEDLHDIPENAIMDAKYGFIAGALEETYEPAKKTHRKTKTGRIDSIVTSKYWGYPIFLLAIFIMFQCTFSLGEYPMQWIEAGVSWFGNFVSGLLPAGILKDLLVDGVIAGVGGVLVFLPNILILYFFITLLESSGYMARAAFIMDKIMHKIGLHGRSFIPLIMGFGCNVPAIMATRTIENKNSRMVTILIAPLMSCSARLPIYLLIAGAFFPNHAGLVLFAIYMAGVLLAAGMARIFKRFLFSKEETPFVMELPPYRIPSVKALLRDTWDKGEQYLRKIGTTILLGSVIIWVLSYFPLHPAARTGQEMTAEMRMEQQENSYLGHIGKFIQPALAPLGFDWKISVALLTGVAAKEVVISTMAILYDSETEDALPQRLQTELKPDGTHLFNSAVALSLMLFVLIYFPCIATIAAIKNETNSWKWALFAALYTILLAWIVSFVVYQSIQMNIYQEILVAVIILWAVWYIVRQIRCLIKRKYACQDCSLQNKCGKTTTDNRKK